MSLSKFFNFQHTIHGWPNELHPRQSALGLEKNSISILLKIFFL